jgi:type I restriction enzyme S subunit
MKISSCFPDSVIGFRADPAKSDLQFVKYALDMMKGRFRAITRGATQDNLSLDKLLSFGIPTPPLVEQQRIGSILSSYDDLIEVNRRRIALLEEMARRLFEEWFVRFRFPGHGSVTSNSSAPDGWATMAIRQLGKVVTGKTPSKANPNFFGGSIPFVKIPDMHGCNFILSTGDHLSSAGAASQSGKTIPPGSLCVSCIATVGLVSITTEPSQTNQQINSVILEREHFREFLFFSLKAAKSALQNLGSNGATMGNVNKDKFEALSLLVPVDSLLQRYHDLVAPMFSAMNNCLRANHALIASRDLLLPRLISGDLTVTSAERELEAVA